MINIREYLDAVGYGKYGVDEFKLVYKAVMGVEDIEIFHISPAQLCPMLSDITIYSVCYRLRLMQIIDNICSKTGVPVNAVLKTGMFDEFGFDRWLRDKTEVPDSYVIPHDVKSLIQQETILCIRDYIFATNTVELAEPWDRVDLTFLLTDMLGFDPDDEELTKLFGVSCKVEIHPSKRVDFAADMGLRCFKMGTESYAEKGKDSGGVTDLTDTEDIIPL